MTLISAPLKECNLRSFSVIRGCKDQRIGDNRFTSGNIKGFSKVAASEGVVIMT